MNAIITVNDKAVDLAKQLDVERKANGPRSKLHGIPIVVKDNYDVVGMPTTAGSVTLKSSYPAKNAFAVEKLINAGAIVIAKTNMSEFAASYGRLGYSSLGGLTLNPYNLNRDASGSSSGSTAAVAPRQRAVLILKDVFEWSSKQIAETLGMSPAAANRTLQRARETMDRTRLRSDEFSKMGVNPDQNILSRYVEAFEQFDIHALVSLFHEEGCMSMPPFAMWISGQEDLSAFFALTRWHCEGAKFCQLQRMALTPLWRSMCRVRRHPSWCLGAFT